MIYGKDGSPDIGGLGAFKCFKKAIPVKFEIADSEQVIETLEGPVNAHAGDYIMTGVKEERWPIKPNKFESTYVVTEEGVATKKKIIVKAIQMGQEFQVKVSWSDDLLTGKPGDYLVQYSENDYGAVEQQIFNETYERV